MKVVIELDKNYSGVISITAIGSTPLQTRVSTVTADLAKCNHLQLGSDGTWVDWLEDEDGGTNETD